MVCKLFKFNTTNHKIMKKIFLLLFLISNLTAFSQDPYLQNSNAKAEKQAKEITNKYVPELGLTVEQSLLFEQKVSEFLMRRYKIEEELSGKEKLNLLYQLQKMETAEMNNILTRPQLEVYKQIKPIIQPLEQIQKE